VKRWVFILLILPSLTHAQLSHRVQISREMTERTHSEAQKKILFEASLLGLEKYSGELGFKYDEFFTKLNEGFETYFQKYKSGLLELKFGAEYQSKLNKEQLEAALKDLEKNKSSEFIKYSRVLELLQSYTFLAFNISETPPHVIMATIDLTLNRTKMERLFRRIVSGDTKQFRRLWIVTDINLNGFNWQDLGLSQESSFTEPLSEAWKKWWEENLPNNFEDTEICHSDCLVYQSNWEAQPANKLLIPNPQYDDSVWIKISLNLKKVQSSFEWDGRVVLLDINTKRLLGSSSIDKAKRSFEEGDQKSFNSSLASHLYQSSLGVFSVQKGTLKNSLKLNQSSHLIIRGHKNLNDVLEFKELLNTRGSYMGIKASLESFQKDEARLLCFFQGEAKVFSDLLSQLKELKSSQSFVLSSDLTGPVPVVKLVTE
jgi:hypothetical protein